MATDFRHLFGPVPSRRYGRSLGVDLSVPKTCSLNCRFCQLGATPATTVSRTADPPISEVLDELRRWFGEGRAADYVTASGSGEPTLHLHFGEIFRFARSETRCRSLLLTNGTLFTHSEVRRDAACADVVKLSLHAWDQASFEQAARPHPSLRFDAILDGYRAFRQAFEGRLDLEVFIIPGFNDTPERAARIAALAATFSPDCVTLNTAVRPPADGDVAPCPPERLRALTTLFGPAAREGGAEPASGVGAQGDEELVALVNRHPVSVAALSAACGRTEPEMLERLAALERQRRVRLFTAHNTRFAGPSDAERLHDKE